MALVRLFAPSPLIAVAVCFVLSGFAALLYQTAWMRLFSIYFGTSEFAVATVLAAYMAGLGLGTAAGGHFATRIRRPVLTYGLLEGAIAVTALLVPLAIVAASAIYVQVVGGQPAPPDASDLGQTAFYTIASIVILIVPTACMGATLPVLLRYVVHNDREVGSRTGLLYALNTAGAVLGTIVAAFLLLPVVGLNATVYVGVAANGLVFLLALFIARQHHDRLGEDIAFASKPLAMDRFAVILPVMALSGFVSFVYEVLWTRLLGHILGGSIYAFATMLAAFLTGIALGGAIGGYLAFNRIRAAWLFVLAQLSIAAGAIATFALLEPLMTRFQGAQALLAALVITPSTLFIGMTFPLAVRVLAPDERAVGRDAASVYAWNTAGAICGALVAAFFLVPGFGFEGALRVCVVINAGLAAVVAMSCLRERRQIWLATCSVWLLGLVFVYDPARPTAVVEREIFKREFDDQSRIDGPELYFGVGRTSSVLIVERFGDLMLRTNGLPEASILRKGSLIRSHSGRWLGLLPVIARPQSEEMLVIGFGGGVVAESVPSIVQRIDIVEIEPKVIDANRAVSEMRKIDPLDDPRVNLVINDARNALRLTDANYDIIVSQPSHPWTAGASHLFTREFLALAKSRLSEGGVFLQWMDMEFLNPQLFRDLVATLRSEFKHVVMYQPTAGGFNFLASDNPVDIRETLDGVDALIRQEPFLFLENVVNNMLDLQLIVTLDNEGTRKFAENGQIITDDFNRMATGSNVLGEGFDFQEVTDFLAPEDPLLRLDSGLLAQSSNEEVLYLVQKMGRINMFTRGERLQTLYSDERMHGLIGSVLAYARGDEPSGVRQARAVLNVNPDDDLARYLAIRGNLLQIAQGFGEDWMDGIVQGATGELRVLIDGWVLAGEERWDEVAQMDARLAAMPVTRPWYGEAALLRAEWRARKAIEQPYLASDALHLVERAIALQPSETLFAMRAYLASGLNDIDRMLDSFRYSGAYLLTRLQLAESGEAPLQVSERQHLQGQVTSMLQAVSLDFPENQSARARHLREALETLLLSVERAPGS